MPLTDDYIRNLIEIGDNDPNANGLDRYMLNTVVAMDIVGAKNLWEWDHLFSDEKISSVYEKTQARIARILFQDGKLSQELATQAGAFD